MNRPVDYTHLKTQWLDPDKYIMKCELCGETFGEVHNHPSKCFSLRPVHVCK